MADQSLAFTISGIPKGLDAVARKLDKIYERLEAVDRKNVDVDVDVHTDKAKRKLDKLTNGVEQGVSQGASRLMKFLFNPKLVTGSAPLVAAAVVAIGTIAAHSFVVAFGAGLAGLGILVASKTKGVQKTYDRLGKHISATFGKAAEPFAHALQAIAPILSHMFDRLAPAFRAIGRILGPALVGFAKQLADAFSNPALTKGMESIARAFAGILRQLGPKLPGLFRQIGEALQDLGDTVSNAPGFFADLIAGALEFTYALIRIIDGLTRMGQEIYDSAPKMQSALVGALDAILHAAILAFDWIPGLGPKLDKAYAKFHSWATKTQTDLNNLPKVHEIKGKITDLQSKLTEAKAELHDPTLTRAQRKEIKGKITDLRKKIAQAKAALFALTHKNYTVTVRGSVYFTRPKGFVGPVIPHRAEGGPVARGRSYLVGERGPEMFTPSESGHITPNNDLGHAGRPLVAEIHVEIGGEVVRVVRSEIRASDDEKHHQALTGSGRVR